MDLKCEKKSFFFALNVWTVAFPISSHLFSIEINCGEPGFLSNGWLENLDGGTGLGASLIFRCYDNMTLVGHTSTVCHIDGKWRYPLPNCFGQLVLSTCSFRTFSLYCRYRSLLFQSDSNSRMEDLFIHFFSFNINKNRIGVAVA